MSTTPQRHAYVTALDQAVERHLARARRAEAERDESAARVREVEAERDELYRLLDVAHQELRALRPLRDRVLLGALDTLAVTGDHP